MSFKFSENHVSNFTSFWPYFLKTLAMSFVSHIFTWISSSKQSFLRYLPTFGLKFSWKRPKTLIFGRYFCDILCDISVKWAKKRAIFFCDCDMEKNPCDTLFFKLYHIAPALRNWKTSFQQLFYDDPENLSATFFLQGGFAKMSWKWPKTAEKRLKRIKIRLFSPKMT